MPDRLIRDELLDSERWLGLPSDTDRLVFVCLLLKCDDFGNFEGGTRRLFRFMHTICQVKTEESTATVLLHLADADMIRRYEVDGRELFHLPRFRPHRQYLVRRYPQSPWDVDRELGKNQRVVNRGIAKDQDVTGKIAATSHTDSNVMSQGVGVGVGENTRARGKSVDNFSSNATQDKVKGGAKERQKSTPRPEARPGESAEDYRMRVEAWKAGAHQ